MPILNISGGGGEKVGNVGNLPLGFVEKTRQKAIKGSKANCPPCHLPRCEMIDKQGCPVARGAKKFGGEERGGTEMT
jgi:hypothetical protein